MAQILVKNNNNSFFSLKHQFHDLVKLLSDWKISCKRRHFCTSIVLVWTTSIFVGPFLLTTNSNSRMFEITLEFSKTVVPNQGYNKSVETFFFNSGILNKKWTVLQLWSRRWRVRVTIEWLQFWKFRYILWTWLENHQDLI